MASAPPKRVLSVSDGVAIVVGIVIGMGIFRAPSLVAGAAGSEGWALGLWALGGVVSLLGALTYAELASAYPNKGGEYAILARAYGKPLAFLFGWARLTVIQPGTIAAAGFVLGDYLTPLLPLGPNSNAVYAALGVGLVTFVNLRGLSLSAVAQTILATLLAVCLVALTVAGFAAPAAPATVAGPTPDLGAIGFAMVFVLLTYGGWNEAAYLSGEVANPQRDMTRILFFGVGAVTILYVAANAAFLHVLGAETAAKSDIVGAAAADAALGPWAALVVTAFVVTASLSTMNGTLFTGARSGYALGQDVGALGILARWDEKRASPGAAVAVQAAVALALVLLGAVTKQGFETMAAYTAPVFWAFFLLTGLAAIVLRVREPETIRPFRMPLFPLPALLFAAAALWMLWSSLTYAGSQAFNLGVQIGVGVLMLGVVLLIVDAATGRRMGRG